MIDEMKSIDTFECTQISPKHVHCICITVNERFAFYHKHCQKACIEKSLVNSTDLLSTVDKNFES